MTTLWMTLALPRALAILLLILLRQCLTCVLIALDGGAVRAKPGRIAAAWRTGELGLPQ